MEVHELRLSTQTPPALGVDEIGATVWPGSNGPLVVAKRVADSCWVRLEGVASYRFPASSPDLSVRCVAVPANDVPLERIVDNYYRVIAPLALQAYGLEALHGTALNYSGEAVLLCATSTTGKSTLADALDRRGAPLIGDDGLVVEIAKSPAAGVTLQPLPFTLLLRERSTTTGGNVAVGAHGGVTDTRGRRPAVERPLRVRAVICLERGPDANTAPLATRLPAAEAFRRLLSHAYAFSLNDQERKRAMLAAYLRFANYTPVYLLRYAAGLERLAAVAAAVEGVVDGAVD